jgi:hypothetical protein
MPTLDHCLHCGKELNVLNRSMLLCRRCVKAEARQTQMRRDAARQGAPGHCIYVSYRASGDRRLADQICERIRQRFGAEILIRDLDSVPLGVTHGQLLEESMARTAVMLVVVDPDWRTAERPDGEGRRLDDPRDFVRMEVSAALRRRVPQIVLNAADERLSARDLPLSLTALAQQPVLPIRSAEDERRRDLDRLIGRLEAMLGEAPSRFADADPLHQLENSLVRTDRKWEDRQRRYRRKFGKPPTRTGTLLSFLLGAVFIWIGVQGLFVAAAPDAICLVVVVVGIGYPIYRYYLYRFFSRERDEYEASRAEVQQQMRNMSERFEPDQDVLVEEHPAT